MKDALKLLSEISAKANDLFFEQHKNIDTLMGIMDKTLRKQGLNADAITIDCIAFDKKPFDKKIVILLHDDKPDTVDIALGNKAGDIFSSSTHSKETLSVTTLLAIMKENFLNQSS